MFKRALPIFVTFILWMSLLGWWVNQWPDKIPLEGSKPDALWRSVTKTQSGWSIKPFQPETKTFVSYQKGSLLLYGIWPIPSINFWENPSLSIPEGGQWIIKILSSEFNIQVKSSAFNGIIAGEWTVFIDTKEKLTVNFDSDMTENTKEKILPSFLKIKDHQTFFDILEQKDVIPTDLWSLYTSLLRRDKIHALGNTTKKSLVSLIEALIAREPSTSSEKLHYDLRAKNSLEEIMTLINKIEKNDVCGPEPELCFTLLHEAVNKNIETFPEVFLPVKKWVQSWLQLDSQATQWVTSWKNIFHTYHNDLLNNNPLARVVRDKSILEMIQSGSTTSQYEIWQYLTRMLADQKLWSIYSLQITREMIRIGESLMASKDISETQRATLTTTAIESLKNLRNLLENAYFKKQEYWFVLRTDLIDSAGKAIQNDNFIRDLQGLVDEINRSTLLKWKTSKNESEDDLALIRGQLVWFKCIFTRNAEYVLNPRVCRVTVSS